MGMVKVIASLPLVNFSDSNKRHRLDLRGSFREIKRHFFFQFYHETTDTNKKKVI
jgi:hypothetical protein